MTHTHKKPLIMLVEDDDTNRHLFIKLLINRGYEIDDYSNGLSAHRQLAMLYGQEKTKHYQLILSDIDMPKLSGLLLAEEAEVLTPETPFIIMTGEPRNSYPKNVKEVLKKPFTGAELYKTIEKYITPRHQ